MKTINIHAPQFFNTNAVGRPTKFVGLGTTSRKIPAMFETSRDITEIPKGTIVGYTLEEKDDSLETTLTLRCRSQKFGLWVIAQFFFDGSVEAAAKHWELDGYDRDVRLVI